MKLVVSEMTYTVSSGTLNPSIPYHTMSETMVFVCLILSRSKTGALFIRRYTLSRFCVAVFWSILMPFSAFFSERIAISDALDCSHFYW